MQTTLTEPSPDRVDLEYENDAGNVRVHRTWINHGTHVRVTETESTYNYVSEAWEVTHRHTFEHDLAPDGETLAGDGSNWSGTGRNWREHAKDRHEKRLRLRFPHDEIND